MIRLAVTSHSFLLDVVLNQNLELIRCQPVDTGYHFGLARHQEFLTVYRGGKSVHHQTEPSLVTYQVQDFPEDLKPANHRSLLVKVWTDIHQIISTDEGAYIANTGWNQIAFLPNGGSSADFYTFGGSRRDIHHVNSLTFHDGKLLALLHNRSRLESEIAVLTHTRQEGFNLLCTRSLWHIGCHNLFIDGRTLVYNASQAHKLVFVDLANSKIINEIGFAGWHTKGLSVTADYYIVGLSEHAVRDRRSTSQGRLAVIDRKTQQIVANVPLQIEGYSVGVGNVNDIRCLTDEEYAAGSEEGFPIEWERTRLARVNPLFYWPLTFSYRLLLPLRRVKQRVTNFQPRTGCPLESK